MAYSTKLFPFIFCIFLYVRGGHNSLYCFALFALCKAFRFAEQSGGLLRKVEGFASPPGSGGFALCGAKNLGRGLDFVPPPGPGGAEGFDEVLFGSLRMRLSSRKIQKKFFLNFPRRQSHPK